MNGTGCADWREVDNSDVQMGQKLTRMVQGVQIERS
jgi:hypothetical protein